MSYLARSTVQALLALSAAAVLQTQAFCQTELPDNYTWLEDVNGKRSMDWVNSHNAASAKILEADPRFAKLQSQALKVAEAPDRLPDPNIQGNTIYNFWQDASHVRGILRRTTVSDYLAKRPHWKTVLDIDALGKKDHKSWVFSGTVALEPDHRLVLVGLSEGGEDAHIYREFDLKAGKFVQNGFEIPKSKTEVAWVDRNHLLVSKEWGPGTLTTSGYPYVTKLWTRGTPLSSAKEVYRGSKNDVGAGPAVLRDGDGHTVTFISRNRTFFESDIEILSGGKATKLGIPAKCEVDGLVKNHLIISINENWNPYGLKGGFRQGSVLSLNLNDVKRDPKNLKPTLVFAPSSTEFPNGVSLTKNKLILLTLDKVQGRAYVYDLGRHGVWNRHRLPVGDNLSVSVTSTSQSDDRFFLDVSGFITPQSLYLGNASSGTLALAKSRKPQFEASGLKVEQLWATSKDGTKVPYFVVHKKNLQYNGENPTLLTAYGGFLVPSTPYYSGTLGKLWLERGGVFALANIRGGGEFGPAWHDAGLKTHRQRIYDDFAAVGNDLVERKITSTRRLGIEGGSNGGLLMGVAMTQHPEMWNAIVIQVPLLDMLGFEHIAAGASWVGEYGSTSVPAERRFLASISPYNQLKKDVDYPEPLIFTTTKDDRVGPVHARKFAARMEEYGKPFFYDEITEGGHSGGADLKQQAHTAATTYIYLMRKLMD